MAPVVVNIAEAQVKMLIPKTADAACAVVRANAPVAVAKEDIIINELNIK